LSSTASGHQYGVGLLTLLVATSVGIGYYQMYYLPEQLATPDVDEHVLHPDKSTHIEMIIGSADPDQQDNFVPKLVNVQLSIDNHVIWDNVDDVPHTVTPDHRYNRWIQWRLWFFWCSKIRRNIRIFVYRSTTKHTCRNKISL